MAISADFIRDVRHGARTLIHAPTFALVAIATMALAIGANSAIFSLADLLVFRDLPVRDPARLVEFLWQYPGDPPMNAFSVENYDTYRAQATAFSDLIGIGPIQVAPGSAPDTLGGDYVTGNFFPALGLHPAWGRLIGPQDDQPAAGAVAVLSWTCWRDRFGLAPDVLGRAVVVGSVPATVIGVADRRFFGLVVGYQPDAWIPASAYPAKRGFMLAGRLKSGVSLAKAEAEMRVLDQARIDAFAQRDPQWRHVTLDVRSARAGMATPLLEQFGKPLLVLMAIVGALLLLACANVGGLLLVRALGRRHEMAVRYSLGATRSRMVRQALTESLLLSATGAVVGVIVAALGARFLLRVITSGTRIIGLPPHLDIAIDGRFMLFTIVVTVLAAVCFGLSPVSAALASAPASTLKASVGVGQPRPRRLFGNTLVVTQVALSLVLLSVADLYIGHLSALRDGNLGFNRHSVLLLSVDVARFGMKPDQIDSRYPDLLAELTAIPGVVTATVSGMTPLSGGAASQFVTVEGFHETAEERRRVALNGVAPNYFATLGTALLGGRDFRLADINGPRVAIVSEEMAKRYFPSGDPIGKRIWFDGQADPFEVIGVAADAKYSDIRSPAPPTLYVDYTHLAGPPSQIAIRTDLPPTQLTADVRRAMSHIFGIAPIRQTTTLADRVDAAIVPERLIATLAGFFGTVGALLAALGLYGLLAYAVSRRKNEIGLRMALGAARLDVLSLVLRQALGLVFMGFLIGLPVAIWSKHLAASVLQNVPAGGTGPILAAAFITIVIAGLAVYLPARRATRVDPVGSLRSE